MVLRQFGSRTERQQHNHNVFSSNQL